MSLVWVALVMAASPSRGVDGGLPLGQVQELIEWHAPEITECLSGTPRRASVRYRFVVGAEGKVTQLAFLDAQKVESTRVTCVGTALEKWRFPVADGGTVIEWDFSASSVDAGSPLGPEEQTPDQFAPLWLDDAVRCYDSNTPSEQHEGRLSLDLVVTRSGAIAEARTADVTPALAETDLAACLAARALAWALPLAPSTRRVRTHWVFATTEGRAKRLFIPSAPAREIIALQPKLVASPGVGLDKSVILLEIRRGSPHVRACDQLRPPGAPAARRQGGDRLSDRP